MISILPADDVLVMHSVMSLHARPVVPSNLALIIVAASGPMCNKEPPFPKTLQSETLSTLTKVRILFRYVNI